MRCLIAVLQPQMINHLVWALSASLAATREIDLSFSSCSYLDVSVHCVLPQPAIYSPLGNASACIGFPHSDISGSLRTYRSPKPFVVRHVLLRLIVPRHSPCALLYLTLLKILSRSLFSNLFSFDCFSVFLGLYSVFNVLTHWICFYQTQWRLTGSNR